VPIEGEVRVRLEPICEALNSWLPMATLTKAMGRGEAGRHRTRALKFRSITALAEGELEEMERAFAQCQMLRQFFGSIRDPKILAMKVRRLWRFAKVVELSQCHERGEMYLYDEVVEAMKERLAAGPRAQIAEPPRRPVFPVECQEWRTGVLLRLRKSDDITLREACRFLWHWPAAHEDLGEDKKEWCGPATVRAWASGRGVEAIRPGQWVALGWLIRALERVEEQMGAKAASRAKDNELCVEAVQ
jgi:hypothetical protein